MAAGKHRLVSSPEKQRIVNLHQDGMLTSLVWADDKWSKVHFNDESKYFCSDENRFIRRRTGERLSFECVKKTVKIGSGRLMV